jgi:DNA modification methylase
MTELINGDCLEKMKDIPDGSIDLVVTSPPYDNLRTYNDTLDWSFETFQKIALELTRCLKVGGVIVWVVGDATIKGSESGMSFRQALYFKECGLNIHDTMIYHKTDTAFARHNHKKYPNGFDYMFVFSKGSIKTFNPILDRKNKLAGAVMTGTVRQKNGETKPSRANGKVVKEFGVRQNVWGYSTGFGKSSSNKIAFKHPAIFPELLAKDHILSWSNEGDIVLDPFMGSGTTGKMASLLNRKFIGIEKDEAYFDIAQTRLTEIQFQGVAVIPSNINKQMSL